MRDTINRIGAVGAGALLALGLGVGSPAGASGGHRVEEGRVESTGEARAHRADRRQRATCLNVGGHSQGRSQSDPDGTSNGGADKPGCTGGFDDDRDGNNGCGNDTDREDDNNGRCRKGDRPEGSTAPAEGTDAALETASNGTGGAGNGAVAGDSGPASAERSPEGPTEVLGQTLERSPDGPTEVLGQTLERSPDVLARTGAGVGGLALLGGLLCGGGPAAFLARRLLRIG